VNLLHTRTQDNAVRAQILLKLKDASLIDLRNQFVGAQKTEDLLAIRKMLKLCMINARSVVNRKVYGFITICSTCDVWINRVLRLDASGVQPREITNDNAAPGS